MDVPFEADAVGPEEGGDMAVAGSAVCLTPEGGTEEDEEASVTTPVKRLVKIVLWRKKFTCF